MVNDMETGILGFERGLLDIVGGPLLGAQNLARNTGASSMESSPVCGAPKGLDRELIEFAQSGRRR